MKMIKKIVKSILKVLHIDLTKNMEYDRLTQKIIKKHLGKQGNCIDVGCHKGEVLDILLTQCPNGKHFGFEPIPSLFDKLKSKYCEKPEVCIYPFALANKNGVSSFQYVINAPAYSGLKTRKYAVKDPKISEIEVESIKMDDIIDRHTKIDFIKIDVEGGELDVLKGGTQTIKLSKPLIIFEFGLGASEFYDSNPKTMYKLLCEELNYKISRLGNFLQVKESLSLDSLTDLYQSGKDYYFIAYP